VPGAPDQEGLNIEEWDGAATMDVLYPEKYAAAFQDPYYLNVILPDERRFLVSEAMEHIKLVPAGTIDGDRKVIIDGRKATIINDSLAQHAQVEALKAWRRYQEHERYSSRLVLMVDPNDAREEVKMEFFGRNFWEPRKKTEGEAQEKSGGFSMEGGGINILE
jgi:hypothetical protein